MRKLNELLTKLYVRNKVLCEQVVNEETGSIGIKEIAGIVAVIVVIGLVIGVVDTNLGSWIGDIWDVFLREINKLTA